MMGSLRCSLRRLLRRSPVYSVVSTTSLHTISLQVYESDPRLLSSPTSLPESFTISYHGDPSMINSISSRRFIYVPRASQAKKDKHQIATPLRFTMDEKRLSATEQIGPDASTPIVDIEDGSTSPGSRLQRIHRHPWTQIILISVICFCLPGASNALILTRTNA